VTLGSADILLTSCVVRALAAGELRTTYTFRCETQENPCRLGTNQAAGKIGTQGFELRFCLPQLRRTYAV
jgi:hypothetical protein